MPHLAIDSWFWFPSVFLSSASQLADSVVFVSSPGSWRVVYLSSSVLNTVSSAGAAMDFGAAHRHAAMHMAVTTDAVACRIPLF